MAHNFRTCCRCGDITFNGINHRLCTGKLEHICPPCLAANEIELASARKGVHTFLQKHPTPGLPIKYTPKEELTMKDKLNPTYPTIVTLCGSTRFSDAYEKALFDETLDGKIVLTVGCSMHTESEIFNNLSSAKLEEIKTSLDKLHLRKIDLSDEILILNVNGYIGESTKKEIEYAKSLGLKIRYLEPVEANK